MLRLPEVVELPRQARLVEAHRQREVKEQTPHLSAAREAGAVAGVAACN
jgi:hypothetical protein